MAVELQPAPDPKAAFCESVVARFQTDPTARDYALAETLYLLTELHTTLMTAFATVAAGPLGGFMGAKKK